MTDEDFRAYRRGKAAFNNDRAAFDAEGGTEAEWHHPIMTQLREMGIKERQANGK